MLKNQKKKKIPEIDIRSYYFVRNLLQVKINFACPVGFF